MMRLKDFSYHLPEYLIAQSPLLRRDEARLMVVNRKTKKIRHERFACIGRYLPKRSVIVINNSKVIPARLLGKKEHTGGKVEIFLLKKLSDGYSFKVLMRPLAKIKKGGRILFNGNGMAARIVDVPGRIVRFDRKDIMKHLHSIGHIPLPPYIKRADTKRDREFYQTVYARHAGSVAAPTAGLHFTRPLLGQLKNEGHVISQVTLHINYATFKLVEEEDITRHKMHFEDYSLSLRVVQTVQQARKEKRKIVAVGTTSCRVLETLARCGKHKGSTDLFIYPGYKFKMTDILVTNFHLPHSSLLMLVYAFGSTALMKRAYKEAIQKKYRFYSYGDAMIII